MIFRLSFNYLSKHIVAKFTIYYIIYVEYQLIDKIMKCVDINVFYLIIYKDVGSLVH